MAFLIELFGSVMRIVVLRGSPERIYYSQRLFRVSLLSAVLLSGLVQWFYFSDHPVFVVLRVFAELIGFMLMMVILTAKIARFRLARMMLVLVLISVMVDGLLLLTSPAVIMSGIDVSLARWFAWGLAAVALYGAASVLAWGLSKPLYFGAGVTALYLVGVTFLDQSFRHLFTIMAGS